MQQPRPVGLVLAREVPAHSADPARGISAEQPAVRNPPQATLANDSTRPLHPIDNAIELGVARDRLSGKHVGERQHRGRLVFQRFHQSFDIGGTERVVVKREEEVVSPRRVEEEMVLDDLLDDLAAGTSP